MVGLGNQQGIQVYAQALAVGSIQRMLGINKDGSPARSLALSHALKCYRGLTARFWPVNLHNTAEDGR